MRAGVPKPGHDLRLVPAALAAWLGAFVSIRLDWIWGTCVLGLVGVVVAVYGWRRRRYLVVLTAVVLLALLGLGVLRSWAVGSHPIAEAAHQRSILQVQAAVVGEPKRVRPAHGSDLIIVTVRSTSTTIRGKTISGEVPLLVIGSASQPGWDTVVVGATIQVLGRCESSKPADSVVAIVRATSPPEVLSPPGMFLRGIESVRESLRMAVADLPFAQRGLVPALVVGDIGHVAPDLVETFTTTGLTHLCAVSGSNLVILLSCVLLLARWCGMRGRGLDVLGLAVVLLFVVLCRGEPSVLRAAAMGLVGLAALGSAGTGKSGLRALATAIIVLLLIDPWLSHSLGFILSVLASAGLVVWASRWTQALARWLPQWVAEAIAVPLAAQLATEPITTWLSGRVSAVGLLANAVAGPLVAPATILGMATTLIAPLCLPLAKLIAIPAGWCARGIVWVAQAGAALPGASWIWPSSPVALVLLTCCCGFMMAIMALILARRWLVITLAVVVVVSLFRAPTVPGWPPPAWAIVVCDVGQGDMTVIRAGPGSAIVVDAGPDARAASHCLDQLGITDIPLLVLTHDHADHMAGLPGVVGRRCVHTVLLSPLSTTTRPALLRDLSSHSSEIRTTAEGEAITVGEAVWTTTSIYRPTLPMTEQSGESAQENDASVVGVVRSRDVSVLITGDIEQLGQQTASGTLRRERLDAVKVPHHGSSHADPEFLGGIGPRLALISVGANNTFGHPHATTIRAVEASGARVVRTDQLGAIALSRVDGQLSVTTSKS